MADLDVQPKKRTSWLPWLIGAIILIALIILLSRSCNNTTATASSTDSTSNSNTAPGTTDTSANSAVGVTAPATGDTQAGWDSISSSNTPAASYPEITNKDISVRGNDNYGIYSLGENVLFETDKATIRKEADRNLQQIAASINQRFKGGDIRVYGYTDSVGSKGYNKELAQQRAEAVRTWLATKGSIDSSHISLNAIGEGAPVASNATPQGRQQNRRVEVIARKAR